MPNIVPISDLKNYSDVQHSCDDGVTVCLTKKGRGKYVLQSLSEYERFRATMKLLAELGKDTESVRRESGPSVGETFAGLEN